MRNRSGDLNRRSSKTIDPVEINGISAKAIMDLAEGTIDAIREPNVLPSQTYARALKIIDELQFAEYDSARVFPPVARFGVSVNDHRRNNTIQDSYWSAVKEMQSTWERLDAPDLFRLCRRAIEAVWPYQVEVGKRGDLSFSPGIIREINSGLQIHFDDAMSEHNGGPFDEKLVGQFAFNLYLSVPTVGGELIVWRRHWRPSDERFKIPGGYGYQEDVVADLPSVALPPVAGEAILFDPRNFHTVRPASDGRRVALAFSIGLTESGRLITWA